MNDLNLAWLVPTALLVIGMAIGLGISGFGYERATRERKSFADVLEEGHKTWWLALAGVIFTAGLCFTRTSPGIKAIAILMTAVLIGMALTSPKDVWAGRRKSGKPVQVEKISGGRLMKTALGIILLIVFAWGLDLGWHTTRLYLLARNLQENPAQIQLDTVVGMIEDAADDVGVIRQDLAPLLPVFNVLGGIPGAGPHLGQIEPLVSYADDLAQAGKEIALGLKPLIEAATSNPRAVPLPERASQAVQTGQAHFVIAAKVIEQASMVRSRIRTELIPASIRPLYLKLDGKFDLLLAGTQALQAAPKLLGSSQAQNYLILAQNRDELRATGGFISGIGLLTVQDGKILQFNLGDSYQIDDFNKHYPMPPEPLHRFMLADYWVTRDANWSPDFPTSAKEAQSLYSLSTGIQTQGVISFNQLAVRRILEAIGPVQVPGTDEPVTAENVEEYMRQAWAPAPEEGLSQEWWLHRKDFMQQLGSALLDKALKSDDQEQLLNLAKTIVDLLDQGQLLVYFNDPIAQTALEKGGWDGELDAGSRDYLYLVDSNVGFNKVDSVIQRSLAYKVDLSDMEHPKGEATLRYQHQGIGDTVCKQEISYGNGTYQDMQQRCYLDYWRLYVPSGSEVFASTAQPVPAEALLNGLGWSGQVESLTGEADTQVFAGLLMLPMGKSSQIGVSYSLPASVVQPIDTNLVEYSLRIQVQPGLEGLPFQLELILPEDGTALNPSEGWKLKDTKTWTWQGALNKSTELSLSIQINP